MTVNEKVYALRMRLGISQQKFADKVGVSKQTVSRWEKANGSIPYQKQIQICEAFHLAKEEVFDDKVVGNLTDNKEIIDRIKSDYEKLTNAEDRAEVLRLILGGK